MSYRNDVALAVLKEDFNKFMETASDEAKEVIQEAEKQDICVDWYKNQEPEDVVVLLWRYKAWDDWSATGTPIREITDWYEHLDNYEFARCGEDTGDLYYQWEHTHKNLWWVVSTNQCIVVNGKEI